MNQLNKLNGIFKEITREEFANFISTLDKCSYEQSVEMADLRDRRGYETKYLAWVTNNIVQVAALTYFQNVWGGKNMGIYYGPVYNQLEDLPLFLGGLKRYLKKEKILKLILFPYEDYQIYSDDGVKKSKDNNQLLYLYKNSGFHYQGNQNGFTNEQIFWHYVKDLAGLSQDSLSVSFSKKGRSLLKKAKTFGIKIRILKRDELGVFDELMAVTSCRRGYENKGIDYYIDLYDSFHDKAEFTIATINFNDYLTNVLSKKLELDKKIADLREDLLKSPKSKKKQNRLREYEDQHDSFVIREEEAKRLLGKYGNEDVVLAGSLFIYTQQELVYLYSGSYVEFNKFYAPALLQEYAMIKAIKKGISFYNMLGVTGNFDGTDGVLGFKQNFNGYVIQKFSSFTYYPKLFKYGIIKSLKFLLGRK
ncbi:peptidoglycan bridge formation glycyltransferase FemA/FemB family protein [Streptococcus tangpeifui]|uniref:peptidoglycan bridge formation glycyltransferase FemA/FemB family protein n=1 Tax=Streptococcus tangpeifui TaxID=2709400 RepID=UPI001F14ACEC|nr:peptidoglycan bridge formation glycyltransferase FemA/FemB family protein [Streptococcus sp. ZJ1593]